METQTKKNALQMSYKISIEDEDILFQMLKNPVQLLFF